MSDIKKQASKMLAEEIIRAIKKITDDNNRQYVNNQLKNYRITTDNLSSDVRQSISAIAKETAGSSSGEIIDLDQQIQDVINSGAVNIPSENVIDLSDAVVDAVIGNFNTIIADTTQTEELYASYGEFIRLIADEGQFKEVHADLAEIGLANIGTAKIDWGQMNTLDADLILGGEGVVGKLTISYLNVSDANIANLTVGSLVVKDKDNNFVQIVVDEKGEVSGEKIAANGDFLENNTVAGEKIIENSITAREIAAGAITAEKILARTITAAQIASGTITSAEIAANTITVDQLSANVVDDLNIDGNATIKLLKDRIAFVVGTSDNGSSFIITDDAVKAIADKIDLSANESIWLSVESNVGAEIDEATVALVDDVNTKLGIQDGKISAVSERVTATENDIGEIDTEITSVKETLTPNGIDAIVSQSQTIIDINGDIKEVSASTAEAAMTANKIYWLISSDSGDSSSMTLTKDAANIISESITLSAKQVNAVAPDIDLTNNVSLETLIGTAVDGKATVYRGEDFPDNANINDLFIQESTGYIYQLTADPSVLPTFYFEDGILYYDYTDDQTQYELTLSDDGKMYISDSAPFVVSVGNNGTLTTWARVKDSELDNRILSHDARIQINTDNINSRVLQSTFDEKLQEISVEFSDVRQEADQIVSMVGKVQTNLDELGAETGGQINSVYSELSQRADSIEAEIVKKVDSEEQRVYIRYDDSGVLELGKSDSRYKTQTSDNGFVILFDGNEMTSMVQNTVSAPVVNARRMFSIGDYNIRIGSSGHLIFN